MVRKSHGFTLLEVLVSLAVITITLSAIVTVSSNRAETLLEIRQRNQALIVADNVLEKFYLETGLSDGVFDGKQSNGDMEWYWQIKIEQTNNEHIKRMDVSVSKDNSFDYSYATLTGFKWN